MISAPRLTLAVVLALSLSPALASAKKKPPSKAAVCLAGGRKLGDQGQHKQALAAFQECLKATPDDAAVESEIAAEAFQVHELDLSEKAARAAVAHAGKDHAVQAAAYYNLGRVAEDRKDPSTAIAAYRLSLANRPSSVVMARLRTLDPTQAAAADPLAPTTMDGPYPSLAAFCKERIAGDTKFEISEYQGAYARARRAPAKLDESTRRFAASLRCTCPDPEENGRVAPASIGELGKPWEEARVVVSVCTAGPAASPDDFVPDIETSFQVNLALRTRKGWYVTTSDLYSAMPGERQRVDEPTLVRHGGGNTLLFTFGVDIGVRSHHVVDATAESVLVVVGLGPSREPSATPFITVAKSSSSWNTGDEGTQTTTEVDLQVSWSPADELVLRGTTGEEGRIGAHRLLFP